MKERKELKRIVGNDKEVEGGERAKETQVEKEEEERENKRFTERW